jgi:hypothetical protein
LDIRFAIWVFGVPKRAVNDADTDGVQDKDRVLQACAVNGMSRYRIPTETFSIAIRRKTFQDGSAPTGSGMSRIVSGSTVVTPARSSMSVPMGSGQRFAGDRTGQSTPRKILHRRSLCTPAIYHPGLYRSRQRGSECRCSVVVRIRAEDAIEWVSFQSWVPYHAN